MQTESRKQRSDTITNRHDWAGNLTYWNSQLGT